MLRGVFVVVWSVIATLFGIGSLRPGEPSHDAAGNAGFHWIVALRYLRMPRLRSARLHYITLFFFAVMV